MQRLVPRVGRDYAITMRYSACHAEEEIIAGPLSLHPLPPEWIPGALINLDAEEAASRARIERGLRIQ